MGRQGLQAFARPDVPDSHRFIETARDNQVALRVEVAAKDVVAVSLECLQQLSMVQFPDLERLIVTRADQ